ncbi:lymphocyte antigen 96 [Varanus komodoensis]|uniref:lymphocyte antigen 96 n=1 Tax=Varanus komodoensis TaxID=61221 RepID=UPI001CF7A899|nr:lymphocyte antigen 96 [Varanus komodoensis]
MVSRHLNMFLLVMLFSVSGFTEEKSLLCRSDDLDIFYSFCGTGKNTFSFKVEPCSLKNNSVWKGFMFWIPKADLSVLTGRVSLWFQGSLSLKWNAVLCHGEDDEYSFCGTLKGETINTTVRISGAQPRYKMGKYIVIFEGFAGHFNNLIICMNYTFVIKQNLME